jgi:hypothetical protein
MRHTPSLSLVSLKMGLLNLKHMKQTAVEWLVEQIKKEHPFWTSIFEQAKEMEKQQIIDSFGVGCHHESKRLVGYQDIAEHYYNETYGSKGSDDHIVDTNEMVDQVPDVRKMVEDDNYLTPVDWLMDRIKWIHRETYNYLIKEGQYDVAKRTENAILDKANELQSSQTEISDEEIEEMLFHHSNEYAYGFKDAIKWYREQLKQRQ